MDYRVIWEIDIEADSPEDAAKKAREIQRDPKSTAVYFKVTEHANYWHIDLLDEAG